VHDHLDRLVEGGFLVKDPTKPRALQVRYEPVSGAAVTPERTRNVPLVGDVAAGTGVIAEEHLEELLPLPERFCGTDESFMLRVRGDSMLDAGILDGDFVVVRRQPDAEVGEVVVAGLPGEEATVKRLKRKGRTVVLAAANDAFEDLVYDRGEVVIYGRVLSVLRRL